MYPHGLYRVVMQAARCGKPIVITENGIADSDDDTAPLPARALYELGARRPTAHRRLLLLVAARQLRVGERLPCASACTRSIPPPARRVRKSGELFAAIARANAITPEMVARYAPGEAMNDVFR